MRKISKLLTLLLASVMFLCLLPMTASADGDAYAILGVQNGDRIILNPQIEGYTSFQHKVTIVDADQAADMDQATTMTSEHFTLEPTATGIDSVVFAIDGETVLTDSEAPYEFVLNNDHKGAHTLTATVNKIEGGNEVKTVAFTGIVGEFHDMRLLNYDSGKLDASNTPTFNGVVSRGEEIVDGALKLSSYNGISAVWLQPDVQTNEMQLGDTKLFYVDYDVYRNSSDTQVAFRTSRGFRAQNLAQTGTISTAMPAGEWVHMTVVADYERGWFSAYMNGVQFKSWEQANMKNDTSNLVTDSIMPYLEAGPNRYIAIDNYAVRTYETAGEAKAYSLIGLSEGEEIALNTTVAPLTSRTVGIDKTDSVYKVVYKVDGVEKATVTTSPFTWNMPFTDVGVSHTVSAVAYTAATTVETAGVSYKTVFVADTTVRTSNNFDSGSYTEGNGKNFQSFTPRGNDTLTVVDDVTGRGGKVVSFTRPTAHEKASRLNLSHWYVDGKTAFNFDIYLPSGVTRTAGDCIYLMTDQIGLNVSSGQALIDLSKVETDKWHSVSVLVDYPAKKVTYCINEDTYVADIDAAIAEKLIPTASVAWPKAFVHIESFNNYYFDNLHIAVQGTATRTDAFLNGYNYVADSDGVETTVSYINMTNDPVDVNIYFALYNGDALVKAWFEPVTVGTKGMTVVNKNIAFAQANGTGTTVKAFCWTPELQPINIGR